MNIRNFKQHLQNVHGSLGNNSENKQMSDRLSEAHPQDVANYDKKMKEGDRSTTKPTTKAGQSLTPNSKSGKESLALEYFDVYFGDNLTEDTRDEDIMEAVYDLVNLCDAVCDAVGLDESKAETKAVTRKKGKYKYGTGPKPYSGSPEGAGASEEDNVYRAREAGQGEDVRGGERVTQDTLRGGTLHNRKQGVTHKEYMTLKKRFGDQIK